MMVNSIVPQVAVAFLAAATPWIVVRVARAAASRSVQAAGLSLPTFKADRVLGRATAVALFVVGIFGIVLPPASAWMAVIDGVAFTGLAAVALRALGDLDKATQPARQIDSASRAASLVRRRHHQYLPVFWRILLFAVTLAGLALFAWRLTIPSPAERRLFAPVAFALFAVVFFWLYETWIHTLVTGATVPDPDAVDRARRWIRMVFATEIILVISLLAVAHLLLDVDWTANGVWAAMAAVAGAVLGVIGCALALSSDLITRRYRVVG